MARKIVLVCDMCNKEIKVNNGFTFSGKLKLIKSIPPPEEEIYRDGRTLETVVCFQCLRDMMNNFENETNKIKES
jgi:hypothetical protein